MQEDATSYSSRPFIQLCASRHWSRGGARCPLSRFRSPCSCSCSCRCSMLSASFASCSNLTVKSICCVRCRDARTSCRRRPREVMNRGKYIQSSRAQGRRRMKELLTLSRRVGKHKRHKIFDSRRRKKRSREEKEKGRRSKAKTGGNSKTSRTISLSVFFFVFVQN